MSIVPINNGPIIPYPVSHSHPVNLSSEPRGFSKALIMIDHVFDYIPGLSTLNNLIDLFLKCLLNCFKRISTKNHYFKYITDKSTIRCVLLLIPILGVFGVAIYNHFTAKKLFTRAQQYEKGEGGVTKDLTEAASLYKQASDIGNMEATLKLAKCHQQGLGIPQSHEKAVDLNKFASENESGEGAYQLSLCYKNGHGVAVNEAEQCRLIKVAEELRHNGATCQLAEWKLTGHGTHVSKNEAEAYSLFKRAAEDGHVASINKLGDCYFNGTGVKQNYPEAVKQYTAAAEKDDAKSILQLSKCYEQGLGGPPNPVEAKKWKDKLTEVLSKKK